LEELIIIMIKVASVEDLVTDSMLSHQVEQIIIIIICKITVVDLVGSITLIQFKSLKKNRNQRKRKLRSNLTMKNSLINLQHRTIFTMNQLKGNKVLISLDPHHNLTNNLHNNLNSNHLRENQLIQKKNKFHFKRILSFMLTITKIPITTTVTPRVI